MPAIRTYKKAQTPSPYRKRSLSPLPNLTEMWERSINPAPEAIYFGNVQTRAQGQRGRSFTQKLNFYVAIDNSKTYFPLKKLGPGQTSPGRSYPVQEPNQPSGAHEQEDPLWTLSNITSSDDTEQKEPKLTKVKALKCMEEMEREIGKEKTKMGPITDQNPT